MSTRPTFRINRSISTAQRSKRLHSEGNKNPLENHRMEFKAEYYSPKPTRESSPSSTISVRRNKLRVQEQRSLRKYINKDNPKFLQTEPPELCKQSTQSKSIDIKEQSNFTILPVPMDQDLVLNIYEFRKQRLVFFPQKTQYRKYSQGLCLTSQINSYDIDFDIVRYNDVQKILGQCQQKLFENNTSQSIRKYLDIISQGHLDNYSNSFKAQHNRLVKTSMLYQRVIILMVAMHEVTQKIQMSHSLLFNLLKCSMDNRVMILSLLQKQMFKGCLYSNSSQILKNNNRQVHNFQIIKNNNDIILNIIYKLSTEKNYFNENMKKLLKSQDVPVNKQFYLLLQYFSFSLHLNKLQDRLPFLAIAPNPYLPSSNRYTLVIDIIEVMYDSESHCFRPSSQLFIQQMSKYYEIVSYSAMMPKDMQSLIRFVDRKNVIAYKLYQHHFFKENHKFKKDLSRLGRSLSNTILIDVQNQQICPLNTFVIKKWLGNGDDKVLEQIMYFLSTISIKNQIVPESIIKYKEEEIKKKDRPRRYTYGLNIN